MKGALREVRDNNGKTPFELTEDLVTRKLVKEL